MASNKIVWAVTWWDGKRYEVYAVSYRQAVHLACKWVAHVQGKDLTQLKKHWYSNEDKAMCKAYALPNVIIVNSDMLSKTSLPKQTKEKPSTKGESYSAEDHKLDLFTEHVLPSHE